MSGVLSQIDPDKENLQEKDQQIKISLAEQQT